MTVPSAPGDLSADMDRERFERVLSVGGAALRPMLIAQLLDDLSRLQQALGDPLAARPDRTAHELKGLAATMGADALAALAAQFEAALPDCGPDQSRVWRQLLGAKIEVLVRSLRAEGDRSAPA